jgi:AraC-like DNA-binding protein
MRPYGSALAAHFGAEEPAFIVAQSLPHSAMAVTEMRVARPSGQISEPLPNLDAYMICTQLQDLRGVEYWEGGRLARVFDLDAGDTSIHDLRRDPVALIDRPVHTMQWLLPRAALDALADDANVPRVEDLQHEAGVGVADAVMRHMTQSLQAAMRRPEQVSRLFVDHVTLAFAAHVAHVYGGMLSTARLIKGGLAPWQQRRAKEMLVEDLLGDTPLAAVAAACGLSPDHFARAFRKSTGLAPHAWLLQARVERAMILLRGHDQSLSEIALTCGFVDQSHFTRVFVRRVGVTPGAWRRMIIS